MPTLGEIRQQFPMYSDVSDSQLLQGLHQKFYSDIPYEKFLGQIDFKGTKYDAGQVKSPVEGNSFLQNWGSGAGKALYDIGQGASQLVGAGESAERTKERRQEDIPLMKTGGGVSGNLMGNITAFAPLAAVPGANTIAGAGVTGATMAALQPAVNSLERVKNTAIGTALGSGMQTVARYPLETLDAAKSIVTAPFKAANAAIEPFYESGRQKILSRALNNAIGPTAPQVQQRLANAPSLVPGSIPTAGEAGESAGLAAMQRSAAAVNPEAYTARAAANNAARVEALQDLAGTTGERQFHEAARSTAANDLYGTAYAKGVDITRNPQTGQYLPKAEIAGVKGEITKLMQRPAIQDAMKEARRLAANEGINLTSPQGSVQGLDYVKRALDDQIGKAAGNEQRILRDLKSRLLTTLDRISPDYAQARTTFAEMSKPITQMNVIQEILNKSVRPLDQTLMPNQYARALSDDTVRGVTGMDRATLENTMAPHQLDMLNAVKGDLARSVAAQNLGRGPGSDTVQKLAMTNLMQRAGIPQGVLNFPVLGRVGNWAYEVADQRMKEALANTLLNPQQTANLLRLTPPVNAPLQLSPAQMERAALAARALALPALATGNQQ